ncbi:MAG: sugar phosphate isomerase/epimerase family protein [Anaerolineae bacterium]|nr:sugar phosphate isomerase/epimerase family protein [Anaerolineae bacterium]
MEERNRQGAHPGGFGACTWLFGEMPLAEVARRLRALEFDGVELLGDLSLYGAAEAGQILRDNGLEVFSLTPADVDLAHPDPAVRGEAVDYYLRFVDFAAELGQPLVACHGQVGRVKAISSQAEERAGFVAAVRQVAMRAEAVGLRLVMEVLNRYEAHLLNTAAEAVAFIDDVGSDHLGILLDAYHMNIEEADPAWAIRCAGDRLWLYHAADSNRQGIGRGHTDWAAQMAALKDVGYRGPIVVECTAPGPNPFTPIKDEGSLPWLETYLRESRAWLLDHGPLAS